MKHFKLNIESKFIPVADLCISGVLEEDIIDIQILFAKTLVNYHIPFDIIEKENQILVAKKKTTSRSITE